MWRTLMSCFNSKTEKFTYAGPESNGKILNRCGDCTACCTVLPIAELDLQKPAGRPCPNLGEKGCKLFFFKKLPQLCREYFCLWRQVDWLGSLPLYRPDRLGVIFQTGYQGLALFEVFKGALESSQVAYAKNRLRSGLHFPMVKIYPAEIYEGFEITPEENKTGKSILNTGYEWKKLGNDEIILVRT